MIKYNILWFIMVYYDLLWISHGLPQGDQWRTHEGARGAMPPIPEKYRMMGNKRLKTGCAINIITQYKGYMMPV